MKHLYTALLALFISFSAAAQLPDGSIAPDFTAEDINGVEHNLYSLLDQGKKVSHCFRTDNWLAEEAPSPILGPGSSFGTQVP